MKYEISPLGDTGLVIKLGEQITSDTHTVVRNLARGLEQHTPPGVIECVAAYSTLTLFYDPSLLRQNISVNTRVEADQPDLFERLSSHVKSLISNLEMSRIDEGRTIELPVCYEGAFAPDLGFVAQHNDLTTAEVIKLHTSGDYLVHMIGFAPGFPYLGGLSPSLTTPRRASPRKYVPAGAVGIGGSQTGVYSIRSPGGWQIIGRTPIKLFRPQEVSPSLLQAGDHVCFQAITEKEFMQLTARNAELAD